LRIFRSECPVIEDTSVTALRAAESFIESNTDESLFDTTVEANGIYGQTVDEPEDLFTIDWNDTNSAIAEMPEGVPLSPRYMIKKLKKIDDDDDTAPTVFRVTVRGTGDRAQPGPDRHEFV